MDKIIFSKKIFIICIIVTLIFMIIFCIPGMIKKDIIMLCNGIAKSIILFLVLLFFSIKLRGIYKNYMLKKDTSPEFDTIYNKLLANKYIFLLEKIRKKAVKKAIIIWVVALVLFIISICIFYKSMALIVFSISLFVTAIYEGKNNKIEKEYKKIYKETIIKGLISEFNNKLDYKTSNFDVAKIKANYIKAKFDKEFFSKFCSDDYIEGYITDDIYAEIADICVTYMYGDSEYATFEGVYIMTKCKKDTNTYIKITTNKIIHLYDKNKIEMDSKEFEEIFNIYSQNKILAMRILTSDVMQLLTNFYTKFYIEFEIVITNNTVNLRFYTNNIFEPSIFKYCLNKKELFPYYNILKLVTNVTKQINKTLDELEIE